MKIGFKRYAMVGGLVAIASLTAALATTVPLAMAEPLTAKAQTEDATPEDTQTHQIESVIFETPPGFSGIQSLGSDSVGVLYPAKASKGNQQLSVAMVMLEPRSLSFLNMDDDELRGYIKYLYLGNQDPNRTYQQREFFQTPITGETHLKRTNRGYSVNEIYLVPLQAGYKVAIFFEADSETPLVEVDNMIKTITKSLREDPKVVKKRIKKLKR